MVHRTYFAERGRNRSRSHNYLSDFGYLDSFRRQIKVGNKSTQILPSVFLGEGCWAPRIFGLTL